MVAITRRAALGGLAGLIARPVFAQQAWPIRPLTLIVGFPAGGPVDIVSRIIGEGLSKRLGQQVVVENKPGATGTIAAAQVARAAPDGYTLTMLPGTFAASAAMFRKLPYDPVKDFSWISTVAEFPYLLATYSEHRCRTIADLIKDGRSASSPLRIWNVRGGLGSAPLGRTAGEHCEHQAAARSVSGRGSGDHRSPREAPRPCYRSADSADGVHKRWAIARARGHQRTAFRWPARGSDCLRSGILKLPCYVMARTCRAGWPSRSSLETPKH